jgi:pimeloyl-ACP methyl ester carboxylesterase
MSTAATHYLDVPGASIYYEVRGSGPLLALIAAPMGGSGFAALVELMAQHYTVVTYDPRGSEHTTVTDRTQITTPELLAEDVHRVLQTVSDEPAAILGSSGGAVTGLALVTAYPEQVSILVAHEPPLHRGLDQDRCWRRCNLSWPACPSRRSGTGGASRSHSHRIPGGPRWIRC